MSQAFKLALGTTEGRRMVLELMAYTHTLPRA